MSILPVLNPGTAEIRLTRPVDESLQFDKGMFKPVKDIGNLIPRYSLELARQVEAMAKTTLGEDRSGSKKWSYWNANPNIQWRISKGEDESQYSVKSITDKGEFEKLTVQIGPTGKGTSEWLSHGHMPGTLVTKFDFSNRDQPEISNAESSYTKYPLTNISNLTRFVQGKDMPPNPQLVHHILVEEAKWLAKLATAGINKIGVFKIRNYKTRTGHVYMIKDRENSLMLETNRHGQFERIFRFNCHRGNKFSFELLPKTLDTRIEDDAELRVINRVAQAIQMEQTQAICEFARALVRANGPDGVSAKTLAAAKLSHEEILNDASCMQTFHVGYNKSTPSEEELHRNHLFSFQNLEHLLPCTGLIYRDPETKYEKVLTDPKDHQDLEDFFKYTKMPPGAVSLTFLNSVRSCKVLDYPSKQLVDLSVYGDGTLRTKIFGQSHDPSLKGKDNFKTYLLRINCKLVDIEVEKAIYRWGIRASKNELAKKGIVYEEATLQGAKDKIYLVDIGSRPCWGNIAIKKFAGNQISTTPLGSYHGANFSSQTLEGAESLILQRAEGEGDLRTIFTAMGFDVANTIDTEKFIQNRIQAKQTNDPVLQHLEQRRVGHGIRYEGDIRLKAVMRTLDELGDSDIKRSSFQIEGRSTEITGLSYKKEGQPYLGYVCTEDPRPVVIKALKTTAQSRGAQAQILKIREFNPVLRTVDMEIRSLAL